MEETKKQMLLSIIEEIYQKSHQTDAIEIIIQYAQSRGIDLNEKDIS